MLWKEVKIVRKGVQREEIGVQYRWLKGRQLVDGDRRRPVLGGVNYKGVESYEVEEGMSKMKAAKAPGLDQCAVDI